MEGLNMVNKTWKIELPGKAFMTFVKELGVIVEDALFVCLENGIAVRAVDPSHVMMASTQIGDGKETGLKIAVDLRRIREAMGGYTKMNTKVTQKVSLEYNENEGHLKMDFGDGNIYTQRSMDESIINPPAIPELDFPVTIVAEGNDAQKIINGIEETKTRR